MLGGERIAYLTSASVKFNLCNTVSSIIVGPQTLSVAILITTESMSDSMCANGMSRLT